MIWFTHNPASSKIYKAKKYIINTCDTHKPYHTCNIYLVNALDGKGSHILYSGKYVGDYSSLFDSME